jgi:hypothetical protein
MPNMEHCRFTNTLADLKDCQDHLDDDNLSEEEKKCRKKLLALVRQIAWDYDGSEED